MSQIKEPNLRQEQAAQTRKKLLASAKKLFAEKGFSGTPVRMINREIGMADGLLYHYFPNGKKEILEILIKESFEAGAQLISHLIDEFETMPLEEVLERIYLMGDKTFTENFITEKLDLLKILIREIDNIELGQMEFLTKLLRERQQWVAEFLKRRYERGEIRKMDFEIAAEQLFVIGLNNLLSKITKIEIGQINTPEKRKRVIRHTLDTWAVR